MLLVSTPLTPVRSLRLPGEAVVPGLAVPMTPASAPEPRASAPPFGALLRRHRLAAGLTQEELAERASVSARAISALERVVNRAPQRGTFDALAGPQLEIEAHQKGK